jgi:hypothetical protein
LPTRSTRRLISSRSPQRLGAKKSHSAWTIGVPIRSRIKSVALSMPIAIPRKSSMRALHMSK